MLAIVRVRVRVRVYVGGGWVRVFTWALVGVHACERRVQG